MTARDDSVLLRTSGITKSFGGMQAVAGIDLEVVRHECLIIIGPNGAGKTTFFNVLTGLLRATTGTVEFEGRDITHLPTYERAQLGVSRTMQITSVFPQLSVLDNVLIGVQARHSPWKMIRSGVPGLGEMRERVHFYVDLLDLSDKAHVPCSNLSHGDRRLVEIAIALSVEARLLLLDEPTAGLSPKETHEITARLRDIWHREKLTLMVVEHDMQVAMELATRVAVLHEGRCIAIGRPEDIMADETVNRIYLKGQNRVEA